uniref:Transcription elongation factor, mitochondrial n=1 Tax=Neolamprologus brichardi TaxID=32507 RepID=A0A3Q4G302_NEOBR
MWVARRVLSSLSGLFCRPQYGSFPELELRYLQCTCCWRSRVPVASFETFNANLSSSNESCKDDASRTLDTCYTPEQRDAILQLLNTATPGELAGIKLLRGRKSLNIVEYRTKNGPFKTLESVVNVPLLKHKSAVIVFNSILNPTVKKERKVRIQLAKFIRPEVISGVWFVFLFVWKFSPFLHRVLNMMRTAVGRHFGLMVGESRTSGAQTVRQLMTESVTQKLPRINFPQDLLVKYRNSFQMGSRRGGEELCDALLQAIAFYELLSDCS